MQYYTNTIDLSVLFKKIIAIGIFYDYMADIINEIQISNKHITQIKQDNYGSYIKLLFNNNLMILPIIKLSLGNQNVTVTNNNNHFNQSINQHNKLHKYFIREEIGLEARLTENINLTMSIYMDNALKIQDIIGVKKPPRLPNKQNKSSDEKHFDKFTKQNQQSIGGKIGLQFQFI